MATLSHSSPAPSPQKERRSYNWGTILYQESAPDNWASVIDSSGVSAVVSPLHDRDELDGGSGLKKPHWHILFHFSSLKSRSQVREFTDSFGGVGQEDIRSMAGSVQYLWHMNSPDKAQYSKDDCICFNGFLVDKYLPQPDRNESFCRLVQLIEGNDVIYYNALVQIVIADCPELLPFCRKDAYSLVNYLKARESEIKSREVIERGRRSRERAALYVPSPPDGFVRAPSDFEF